MDASQSSSNALLTRIGAERLPPAMVAAGIAVLVAITGGLLTNVGPWYRALAKSPLNPPDWVFAPAWTVIYGLCVAAGVIAWKNARTARAKRIVFWLFIANAVLNVAWSGLFFTMQRPDWALIEVATLWASVAGLMIYFREFAIRASILLTPYLIWVAFAAHLNYAVVQMNGPFG
ncbi:MAG: TspO/MBR family protein [Pseudomonadota bacterium]